MNRRTFITHSVSALVACACSGGSSNESASVPIITPVPTPNTLRSDLFYGYYGSYRGQLEETSEHVSLYFTTGWGYDGLGMDYVTIITSECMKAVALNVRALMLDLSAIYTFANDADAKTYIRTLFDALRAANVLSFVKVLYPKDEPNLKENFLAESLVLSKNALVRSVVSEYPELNGVRLAVFYADNGNVFPGISSYDWIGMDNYNLDPAILLSTRYNELLAQMRPEQKLMLIPGPAFDNSDAPFFSRAEADSRIACIMPFIWFDNWDQKGAAGLRSKPEPLRCAYNIDAQKIKNPNIPTPLCVPFVIAQKQNDIIGASVAPISLTKLRSLMK